MKLFRIEAQTLISQGLIVAEPAEEPGGPPRRYESISRLPQLHARYVSGVAVALGPAKLSEVSSVGWPPPGYDSARLAIHVQASEFSEALQRAQPVIETIIDQLSFQLQEPLQIVSLVLVDVTPPVHLGEDRRFSMYTNPSASILPKFYQNPWDLSLVVHSVAVPSLETPATIEKRHRLALWWYIKSLAVPFLVDQFLFLFTSLEQLSHPHAKGPYKTDCNHEIKQCPVCAAAVHRPLVGASIRNYLVEVGGISEEEAGGLWRVRQAVHGKDIFSTDELNKITVLAGVLRAVVFKGLKSVLQLPTDTPPDVLRIPNPVMGPSIIMEGFRAINEDDLHIDRYLASITQSSQTD